VVVVVVVEVTGMDHSNKFLIVGLDLMMVVQVSANYYCKK